jgi:hypothetical protein
LRRIIAQRLPTTPSFQLNGAILKLQNYKTKNKQKNKNQKNRKTEKQPKNTFFIIHKNEMIGAGCLFSMLMFNGKQHTKRKDFNHVL